MEGVERYSRAMTPPELMILADFGCEDVWVSADCDFAVDLRISADFGCAQMRPLLVYCGFDAVMLVLQRQLGCCCVQMRLLLVYCGSE